MGYEITTFDVCVSGFERLRSQDEFILLASVDGETDSGDLLNEWLADIQSCDREDDFDYEAAREAVRAYYQANVHPLFDRKSNPFDLEPRTDDGEGCNAYLFVRRVR